MCLRPLDKTSLFVFEAVGRGKSSKRDLQFVTAETETPQRSANFVKEIPWLVSEVSFMVVSVLFGSQCVKETS